ncbi:hypothetical protein PPL_07538 [Heterostelium album PN500]|uniref:Restriction endonuclease type IV Mrr domain-containing protein n=1 Tax=Heterostelium pallidum (strain ATCC 26659 / Pp 5 / PN500) TaxID=670386 RepID=D3BG87_HETP5|nr:hypothetical protein PPL_07538 [Heterostelium album PN500]EFA79487.1 hypothetical protein PPL_07538 [Heterostelium album PN500]|eukprot:XP_020431608.1 hypothetical protein PPL_07538 [Heterostelium album PN500]
MSMINNLIKQQSRSIYLYKNSYIKLYFSSKSKLTTLSATRNKVVKDHHLADNNTRVKSKDEDNNNHLKVVHDSFISLADLSPVSKVSSTTTSKAKKISLKDDSKAVDKPAEIKSNSKPKTNEKNNNPKWMSKKWFTTTDIDIDNDINSLNLNDNNEQKEVEEEIIAEEEEVQLELLVEKLEEVEKINNVKKGTDFELLSINALSKYGFDLKRVGGAGDKGIDFTGVWRLPESSSSSNGGGHSKSSNQEFNIVGQCKHYKTRIGPVVLREFESTLQRFIDNNNNNNNNNNCNQSQQQQFNCIGILTSYTRFSDILQSEIDSINNPLILSQITEKV